MSTENNPRTIVGSLYRERGREVEFTEELPCATESVRRPAKVARMLALAHHIQRMIDDGRVPDRAAMAKRFKLTRARLTQLLDLILLAPDIQEAVLHLEAVDGVDPLSERSLRVVARQRAWGAQRALWQAILAAAPKVAPLGAPNANTAAG